MLQKGNLETNLHEMHEKRIRGYEKADLKISVDGLTLTDIVKRIIHKLKYYEKNIETLNVKLKSRSYPIYIGKSLLKDFNQLVKNIESYSKVILITDNKVKKSLGGYINNLSKKF